MKDLKNDVIKRYSEGRYSYNDYLVVKEWFTTAGNEDVLKNNLYPHWKEILKKDDHSRKLDHIFRDIHYNILLKESQKCKSKTVGFYFRQIAAILIFSVMSAGIVYFFVKKESLVNKQSAWVEINAPLGSRIKFMLPDSTTGWLNSGSKLKYPLQFSETRRVKLSGEGYFSVKHMKNNAGFIVNVSDMDIKVLGTKFNVTAYNDDDYTDVLLEKGKVEVIGKTGTFNRILSPNEKISYNRTEKKVILTDVNASRSSAWKDGYLIIDNEPLGKAINRIERWYNVDIEIVNKELKNYRFKATFIDEPLREVLELLAKTTPITYKIEKRTTNESNILKKRKVIIKLK